MLDNRTDAGKKLAKRKGLREFKNDPHVLVLAIPRGGVPVGIEIAKELGIAFDIIICRKIKLLDNPESGIGAVSEMGKILWHPPLISQSNPSV